MATVNASGAIWTCWVPFESVRWASGSGRYVAYVPGGWYDLNLVSIEHGYERTIIAKIDISTVTIVQLLESTRQIDVQVKVRGVKRLVYAGKFAYNIRVHILRERRRGLDLIVCRGMERKRLGDHIDNLEFNLIRVCMDNSQGSRTFICSTGSTVNER